ncbi:MAG: VRR-NUC domain-containing protein [Polaromonas sp.]
MKLSPLVTTATKLGIKHIEIQLNRSNHPRQWLNPLTGKSCSVEQAVLDGFSVDGWRGFSGEGGLILNLIKSMSFKVVAPRHRATYIEALYAQNVAFAEDRYEKAFLLETLASSDEATIIKNFDFMASSHVVTEGYGGSSSINKTSMLDFFPGLEQWMFVGLFRAAGTQLIHRIASKFSEDPYEYRRGWPDITMWRDEELRFVEVKAPRDKIQASQKKVIEEFAIPLGLDFWLAEVIEV